MRWRVPMMNCQAGCRREYPRQTAKLDALDSIHDKLPSWMPWRVSMMNCQAGYPGWTLILCFCKIAWYDPCWTYIFIDILVNFFLLFQTFVIWKLFVLYIPNSIKVALSIGNCALGNYCLAVTQAKNCIVFVCTNAQLPMTKCQSNLYWIRYMSRGGVYVRCTELS